MLHTDLAFADDAEIVDENISSGDASARRVDWRERPARARGRVDENQEDSCSWDGLNHRPVDANMTAFEYSIVTPVGTQIDVTLFACSHSSDHMAHI